MRAVHPRSRADLGPEFERGTQLVRDSGKREAWSVKYPFRQREVVVAVLIVKKVAGLTSGINDHFLPYEEVPFPPWPPGPVSDHSNNLFHWEQPIRKFRLE